MCLSSFPLWTCPLLVPDHDHNVLINPLMPVLSVLSSSHFFWIDRKTQPYNSIEGVAGYGYNLSADEGTDDTAEADEDGYDDDASDTAEDRATVGSGGDGSVDPEDTWWVAAAAGAGVGLGILLCGGLLMNKFGKRNAVAGARAAAPAKGSGGAADETKAEPM